MCGMCGRGLFMYTHIYVYICMCVCLCVHALPPASILCGWKEAFVEVATRSFKSKEPVWLLFNRHSMILLNWECSSERYEQGTRKLFPAAWAPGQHILRRMLFPQGLLFTGRGGGALRSTYFGICDPLVGGTQGIGGRPAGRFWSRADRWRYSLQAGFLVGVSKGPPEALVISGGKGGNRIAFC